jgi:hypothetical protein
MTEPALPAYIPGRTPPRRGIHPAVWAVAGAVVALLAAGGAYLALRPAATKAPTGPDRQAQVVSLCEDAANEHVISPASSKFSDVKVAPAGGAAWTVFGKIDTANGLGVLRRTYFRCSVADGAGGLVVTSSSVDEPL